MRRLLTLNPDPARSTYIAGKDLPLEQTIANMSGLLADLGIKIEIASWRNLVPNVWSLHIRDAHSPMCFTNGKGATKESAWPRPGRVHRTGAPAAIILQRPVLGRDIANAAFVHYPNERWFKPGKKDALPEGPARRLLPGDLQPDGELRASHLYDTNSGNVERGICACPTCASRTARWCISRPT